MRRVLSSSKQSQLLLRSLLRPRTVTAPSDPLLRHLCTEAISPPPPQEEEVLITKAVELLQSQENEYSSSTQLHQLLFASSSPGRFRQIARRLASSTQALKFFDYIQSNSPSQDLYSLSLTFQAIFELASREPDSQKKLLGLYRTSKEKNIPLTTNGATLLVRCFGRAGMVDDVLGLANEVDPSLKNTHFRNTVIDVLLRLGCADYALIMLDEMIQPNAEWPPNDITGDTVFAALCWRGGLGRIFNDEESAGLVSKFCENGVVPDTYILTQLITKFCRNRNTDRAWDVLRNVMKSGGVVEAASCNALLTGLAREDNFERMNTLMAEMKQNSY